MKLPPLSRTLVSICLLLAVLPASSQAEFAENRPNIIFIMVDDLGYGDLGCYGQQTLQTPNIDQLASEGIRFTDFYAGNPVCRPSRLSLWVGKDTRHTPINGNALYALDASLPTTGSALKQAGYATAGLGKWSLFYEDNGHPNDSGFDHWFGYLDQSLAHNHFPPHLWRNREKVLYPENVLATGDPLFNGRVSAKKHTFAHTEMTEEALGFIRDNRANPFLLHIHWTVPHANNEAGRTLGDGMEVPEYGAFANEDWPSPEKGFAAMIRYMDTDVGRISDLLAELEIADHTLVIFTSDNGPHAEGNHDHEFFDSNGVLRGLKRDVYEGGIRVPFIARWPNKIKAGTEAQIPAALCDMLPTFAEIAGANPPQNIDGISLLPTFLGEKQEPDRALAWVFEEADYRRSAVRFGKWKAVQMNRDTPWELYDLSQDISEQNDLAETNPKQLAELIRRFED